MIITKRITRKKIQKGEPVDYNVEYITEKPQHYINKYIKVVPVINEMNNVNNNKSFNYNNSNSNEEIQERTKEEILTSLNYMLKVKRKLLKEQIEQSKNESYSLTRKLRRF